MSATYAALLAEARAWTKQHAADVYTLANCARCGHQMQHINGQPVTHRLDHGAGPCR